MGSKQDRFINTLADLSVEWYRLLPTGYREQRGNQRFGQYVINSGLVDDLPLPWTDLFNVETYLEAYSMLYSYGLQIEG